MRNPKWSRDELIVTLDLKIYYFSKLHLIRHTCYQMTPIKSIYETRNPERSNSIYRFYLQEKYFWGTNWQ